MKKFLGLLGLFIFLASCNNSRVNELEIQVSQQKTVIESQRARISELESQLSECEDNYNQQATAASDAMWHITERISAKLLKNFAPNY